MGKELTLCCPFCQIEKSSNKSFEEYIFDNVNFDDSLCKKHSIFRGWFSVCEDCVGGFPICNLARVLFNDTAIESNDLDTILEGKCPFKGQSLLIYGSVFTVDGMIGKGKICDKKTSELFHKYVLTRIKESV